MLEEEVKKRDDIKLSPDWTKVEYLKCLYNADFKIKNAVEVSMSHISELKIEDFTGNFLKINGF